MTPIDDTQARLLEAAGEIFAEEGFKAATVRKIVERAGVSNVAAIHYYFGDKEALYCEAVKTAFQGRTPAAEMPAWPPDAPPAVKLRAFIRGFAAQVLGNHGPAWHMRLMARELTQPTAGCDAFVRDFARPHFDVLTGLLREVLPADTPAGRVHLTAISIIGQVIHHRCARAIIAQLVGPEEFATYDAGRLAEHIADFSLAALGLAPPLAREEPDSGSPGR
jgi:TetR/AcrR family transcriptional regulator, regulator of cefoperazone and chloramphenicol sensitivity